VDGNTVRVAQPQWEEEPKRQVSSKTRKNRTKAMSMNRGFVVFLSAMSVAAMFMCVSYVQLKTEITKQTKQIASLQTDLNDLKSDNDALENSYEASVDLTEIYQVATEKLGMHYPNEGQVISYSTDGSGFVRKYCDVPTE
jgi:cell division protein FtsL